MSQKQRGKPSGQRSASSAGKGVAGNSGFLDIAGLLGVEGRAGRYLLASFVLHIVVALSLFVSWDFLRDDEVLVIPEYIDAHVISQQELEQLMSRKDEPQKKPEPKKEVEPPEPEKQQEEERQQEIEELQREVEAKKKALLQKKEEERKEQEKKEKLAKEKKEKELKDKKEKELKEKKEKEKKEKEKKEKEKKAKEKKEKEKKEKDKKEKDKKELERLRQDREANLMKKLAEAEARENAAQSVEAEGKAASARELTEVERYLALIKKRVEDVWRKPPDSGDLVVELEIRLLPNGELAGVEVTRSSGVVPFDRSALNAVQSNMEFPVPDDSKLFEKYFREFKLTFRGQD